MIKPKYILIDLNEQTVEDYPIEDQDFKDYIGGKALAAKILYELLPAGVSPFDENNILIINTGPLTGTSAPSSARFNVTTKNVLTGGIASSNCGGSFGVKLRRAGFDGIIIKGKSETPVYIEINEGKVFFRDAKNLWGLDTIETQKRFPKNYGKIVIGPAGENLVFFASIASDDRMAGRTGVGAVMGSKNLKAIIANGSLKIPVSSPEKLKKFAKKWTKNLRNHYVTGTFLPRYGTSGLVRMTNRLGMLPVKNFSERFYNDADKISGEKLAEDYLEKNSGCGYCPIHCGREIRFNGEKIKGPEYETVALLGSNLLNNDLNKIIKWNYLADLYGMDTISLAGTIAFAMELKEKGIKDFGVEFGKFDNLEDIISMIAFRKGVGEELANGTKYLSEKYGGGEFAIHSKGLEISAYDPQMSFGMGLGYATSNRGACHLNGGYMVYMEGLGPLKLKQRSIRGKAILTIIMQNLFEAISSAGVCLFTSYAVFPNFLHKFKEDGMFLKILGSIVTAISPIIPVFRKLLKKVPFNLSLLPYSKAIEYATGIKMNFGKFYSFGERAFNIERAFNVREGISKKDDTLPKRILDSGINLEKMLNQYYKYRDWDKEGKPKGVDL